MDRVEWVRPARRELANIWMITVDKNAVTSAANYTERLLMIDPTREGIAIPRSLRRGFVTPLTVEYRVNVRQQLVSIAWVQLGKV